MMKINVAAILAWLVAFCMFGLYIAMIYGLVPFVLMHILTFFGVEISYLLCVGICFLVYFIMGLVRR